MVNKNVFGFDFPEAGTSTVAPYDNKGACEELLKDMSRKDNLSIVFYQDKEGYASCNVESKNVSAYKVRLNPSIFKMLIQYLENGTIRADFDSTPMEPINKDAEGYRVNMLKLFVCGAKKIQWTPLFRERNGKVSGTHIAKFGKIFFYVNYADELVDWLREMKQAI